MPKYHTGIDIQRELSSLRNTKVVDLIQGLERYGIEVVVVDPWVNQEDAKREYDLNVLEYISKEGCYDAVVAAVAHVQFSSLTATDWKDLLLPSGVLMDLKGIVPRELNPLRL